jgi:hypothetical protein
MMSKAKKTIYTIPGCETRFYEEELSLLFYFFKCETREEKIQAAQRLENLFLSREILPCEVQANLFLALQLASELYEEFTSLEKPLTHRHPTKKNGPSQKIFIPPDILEQIENLTEKEQGLSNLTQLEIVKRLQRKGILSRDLKASSLVKAIQDFSKRRKELIEAFEPYSPDEHKS